MTLTLLRCLRSTSPLRYGHRGLLPRHAQPPGLPLPRHARPRRCQAHLQRPRWPTSRPPCVRALVPHPGSCLYARSGPSSITTPVDLSYRRLQLLLPQLHLHRPPHFPRAPLLCLLWRTSTPCRRVRRAGFGCLPPSTPPPSLPYRRPSVAPLSTLIGEQLWKKNTVPCYRITLGISCLDHLGPM